MNERRKAAAKRLNAFFGDGPAEDLSPAMRDAMARLQASAQPRPSRVQDMLLAGRYRYVDFEGATAQLVDVTWELGECVGRFPDAEPEDGEVLLLVNDMAGKFEGPIPATAPPA